jgi:cytochrome c oxidase cbb3-type subunit 3
MRRLRQRAMVLTCGATLVIASCEREERRYPDAASLEASQQTRMVRLTSLAAGGDASPHRDRSPHQDNAFGIAEGKRLYTAFNCNGCHAAGGGGIGPALMDDKWIYGHGPDQIFASVVQGRPNGMPSFSGRLTDDQVWQLVAYVQSLSAQTPRDAATSRSDDQAVMKPELRLERLSPRQTGHR